MERLNVSTNIEARPVMKALHVALTRDDWGAEWTYPFTARTLCAQMERDCEITVKTSGRFGIGPFDRLITWSDVEEGLGELARDFPKYFATLLVDGDPRAHRLRGRVYFKACVLLLELAVWGHTMSEDMEEG
jgi:hypothetical protein